MKKNNKKYSFRYKNVGSFRYVINESRSCDKQESENAMGLATSARPQQSRC